MIVKRLRHNHKWSQEQLAELCGLNVRTIQRVEKGSKASIETLKCLASVFEVDISILTEEITVINKESEKWRAQPWWFRASFWGVHTRKTVLYIEFSILTLGLLFWVFAREFVSVPLLILSAYLAGWYVRYGDNEQLW